MFPIDLGMVESRSASANDMSNLETAGPPPGYCSGMPEALNESSAMGHHPESSDMSAVAASVTGAGSSCTHHLNPKRKYEYEIEFLRSLQSHPLSLKKPDLPDLDIVQQVPIPHREKKTNRINDCLDQAPIIRPKISTKPKNPSKSSNEYIIKEKKKSLLPLSNITENCSTKLQTIQDIEFLIGRSYTIPGTNNDDEARKRCLLFLDKDDVKELVQEEIRNHKTNNNFSLAYQVSALKGDLKETIIEASRAKQLNDWLVAMSASISREFWFKIALLYAVQLENSNEFTQAAMYYSSVHRITDAVRVLLKAGLYKESLILVKNSAPFHSQLIGDILNAWAKNKESQDNLEFAAKIYAANLEPGEAARCLAERKEDSKCQSLSRILYSAKPLVINPN